MSQRNWSRRIVRPAGPGSCTIIPILLVERGTYQEGLSGFDP
jgi:hypothetical protein